MVLGETLSFCGFSGLSCCDAAADAALRDHFVAMNISDPVCAAAVKATTCAVRSSIYTPLFACVQCVRVVRRPLGRTLALFSLNLKYRAMGAARPGGYLWFEYS